MTENPNESVRETDIQNTRNAVQESEQHIGSTTDDLKKSNISFCESGNTIKVSKNDDTCNETADHQEMKETNFDVSNINFDEESSPLHDRWQKFDAFLKKFYRTILNGKTPSDEYDSYVNIVKELVTSDPHQLFARLEVDLQEFIIELKLRQMELLDCVLTDEGPDLFIYCLVDGYNKVMFAAYKLSPLLLQLEVEHLARFNISWCGLSQHLFYTWVFTDPKIQKVLPHCINKLAKGISGMSVFNRRLIFQFLTFDDEMTKVGEKWREAKSAIIKYHQENSMLDAKWRMTKVNWDLIRNQTKVFHEELKSAGISACYEDEVMNGHFDNSIPEEAVVTLDELGKKPTRRSASLQIKSISDSLKKMKINLEAMQDQQQLCVCCQTVAKQSANNACLNISVEEIKELLKENDMDLVNGDSSPEHYCIEKQSPSTSDLHKTFLRKQVITQQRQQHQKKLMQMMQSSQQKDIQQKIQKQLQEHQLLLQQQRTIDELHVHLLQQHSSSSEKDAQKSVQLQVQHRLIQKQKQVEERLQQYLQQQHQEKLDEPGSTSCSLSKVPIALTNSPLCSPGAGNSTNTSSSTTSPTPVPQASPASPTANTKSPIKNNSTVGSSSSSSNSNTQKTSPTQPSSINGQKRPHPLSEFIKSANYVCPKHGDNNIKQNGTPFEDADHSCSSEYSSEDEFDWERSNSLQRHCDCCYCEVFGSAPVSRNFQETRERLRLILTKKKAKSNASNDKSNNQESGNRPVKEYGGNDKKLNQGLEYKGDKSIEEIMDFIEGNKHNNIKRTAKKMRRKQRQLEEEERRRKEEEAERLRQEELRRKEEEEKRRLEEEKRKQELMKKKSLKRNKKELKQQQKQQQVVTKEAASSNQMSSKKSKNDKKSNAVTDNVKLTQNRSGAQKQTLTNNNKNSQQMGKTSEMKHKETHKQLQSQPTKSSDRQQQNDKKIKGNQVPANGVSQKKSQQTNNKSTKNEKDSNLTDQPQMVTIKRVMQPNCNEPTVTITLRGATPKEDKVLYTLQNGQMCQVKGDAPKKQNPIANASSPSGSNKKNIKTSTNNVANNNGTPPANIINQINQFSPNPFPLTNYNQISPGQLRSFSFAKNNNVTSSSDGGVASVTQKMEKIKLNPAPSSPEVVKKAMGAAANASSQPELTTPTAIQINQAVNQLSSRPSFPNNFDLENIKLPPGITITKVDPNTAQRKPIQIKQQQQPPSSPPVPRAPMCPTVIPPVACSSNVIVVDTNERNDESANSKKKRRRRKNKDGSDMSYDMNGIDQSSIPSFMNSNGLAVHQRINPGIYSSPFMNSGYGAVPQQQPAAIIQMNGSMVTIRNPALHQAYSAQPTMMMDQSNIDIRNMNGASEDVETGEADEYEQELEAFKQFCSQSVPAESKAKVNLNIEDIVLKKKGPVIGCS